MSMKNKDLQPGQDAGPEVEAEQQQPQSAGRRALLRGSMAAMPAILTLQSGAALARSSNLISGSDRYASTDSRGRTLCLDVDSVYPVDGVRNVYDLGTPPYAKVNAIKDRRYRRAPYDDADRIGEARMCKEGGTFYFEKDGRWRQRTVPQGMLVSATALSSFAGDIIINDL